MPKEHRKRGRREEKKRKRQEEEEHETQHAQDEHSLEPPAKRPRSPALEEQHANEDFVRLEDHNEGEERYYDEGIDQDSYKQSQYAEAKNEFYGLLDEEEQSYFKRADNMLEVNQFAEAEERELFLESVWKELHGKELRVANSQSCSRFLERVIRMSKPAQLKTLFEKFRGHFLFLVQHRFASHCCEALFLQTAPNVTAELVAPDQDGTEEQSGLPSMEDAFLGVVDELEGNMGYLMTDNFASHALRVLLVVLSGKPLDDFATLNVLKSKKKENIQTSAAKTETGGNYRTVPDSFSRALRKIIVGTLGELDTNYLRSLATHPVGNPVLQLLLEVEFSMSGKQKAKDEKSLFRRLLPEDVPEEGTMSAAFIKGLLYDPVGSRLLETIIRNAPGKTFKAIYRTQLKENLKGIIRNEVAGYVAIRALERLSHDNLQEALDQICVEIPTLMERSRTTVVNAMIEQSRLRKVEAEQIARELKNYLGPPGPDTLLKPLKVRRGDEEVFLSNQKAEIEAYNSSKRHASLLMQKMLETQDVLRSCVFEYLLGMNGDGICLMSLDKNATYVIQSALMCHADEKAFIRKFVPAFQGHAKALATDPIGSHVLDAIWNSTASLHFLRERIAKELLANEAIIKDTFHGRAVWRNWNMDVYKRQNGSWKGTSTIDTSRKQAQTHTKDKPKSAIELARERFAARKTAPGRAKQTRQTVFAK